MHSDGWKTSEGITSVNAELRKQGEEEAQGPSYSWLPGGRRDAMNSHSRRLDVSERIVVVVEDMTGHEKRKSTNNKDIQEQGKDK